jgi:hypothetical protein
MDTTDLDGAAALFGNRFVSREVPTRRFPDSGMTATDAMRLVSLDLALEGDPTPRCAHPGSVRSDHARSPLDKRKVHTSERNKVLTGPGH